MPYSPRLALRVGERQSWVKCLVQEHNVAAAGSDGSSLPTQSHFTATPGDQAFEPPSGFESPTLSITSRARYRLSHRATTTAQMDALAVAQRKMERIMLGITLRDQRHNTWIRQQTGVTDITDHIRQSKHRWAGHVARLQDNRWTIRATSWVPRRWLRPRGRPKTRWRDDLSRHLGTTWTRLAQDRHQWKLSREGFLHKGEK